MRRFLLLALVIITIVVNLLATSRNVQAAGTATSYVLTCSSLSVVGTSSTPYLGVEIDTITFTAFPTSGGVGSGTLHFPEVPLGTTITFFVYGATNASGSWDLEPYFTASVTCPSTSAPYLLFTDGRVNKEAQATVVAYCNSPEAGDIEVYAIDHSKGYYAFTATKEEIAAIPAKPAVNTLIQQALGAQLWRLTNGNLEIRRGADDNKVYAYQWPNC